MFAFADLFREFSDLEEGSDQFGVYGCQFGGEYEVGCRQILQRFTIRSSGGGKAGDGVNGIALVVYCVCLCTISLSDRLHLFFAPIHVSFCGKYFEFGPRF